jgi:predicted CXXCH cytochrome family protein
MAQTLIFIRKPGKSFILLLLVLLAGGLLFNGCDSVSRHKVLTTIFDGVPSQVPPEKILEDYYQQRLAVEAARKAAAGNFADGTAAASGSRHLPYAEKKCKDCHDFTSRVGLVRPRLELCVMCHRDFIIKDKTVNVHGPVAVGDCSACHLPHTSPNKALLERNETEICSKCHQERRQAARMHDKVVARGMTCVDCHDPHYGGARYFLK